MISAGNPSLLITRSLAMALFFSVWCLSPAVYGAGGDGEADTGVPRFSSSELELVTDNDSYLMTLQDQYYTNGLFLNFRRRVDASRLRSSETNRLWEFSVGHEMYNSYTAEVDSIQQIDRPFAAYLFLSAGRRHFYHDRQMLSYSFSVGSLGERAFGEALQVQFHEFLKMYEAMGWEYQLKNSWSANANIQYHATAFTLGSNLLLEGGIGSDLAVGTHKISVSATPLLRFGQLNALGESAHFNARLQSQKRGILEEYYLFYQPTFSYLHFDETLQGGMFVSDKGPFVTEPMSWNVSNQFGLVLAGKAVTFKIRYFFNSKEAKTSLYRHQYGSLSLAYQF